MSELFKNKYRIQSSRLPGWDYRNAGGYFVTICTQNRECWFGEIRNGEMLLSDIGKIADQYWREIPEHFKNVQTDEFVIMPNHSHGILFLMEYNQNQKCRCCCRDVAMQRLYNNGDGGGDGDDDLIPKNLKMSQISPKPGSLSTIIRSYKSAVKRWAGQNNYPDFAWQPRFYDRVIRNNLELQHIREYIWQNPQKWELDSNHPQIQNAPQDWEDEDEFNF